MHDSSWNSFGCRKQSSSEHCTVWRLCAPRFFFNTNLRYCQQKADRHQRHPFPLSANVVSRKDEQAIRSYCPFFLLLSTKAGWGGSTGYEMCNGTTIVRNLLLQLEMRRRGRNMKTTMRSTSLPAKILNHLTDEGIVVKGACHANGKIRDSSFCSLLEYLK